MKYQNFANKSYNLEGRDELYIVFISFATNRLTLFKINSLYKNNRVRFSAASALSNEIGIKLAPNHECAPSRLHHCTMYLRT